MRTTSTRAPALDEPSRHVAPVAGRGAGPAGTRPRRRRPGLGARCPGRVYRPVHYRPVYYRPYFTARSTGGPTGESLLPLWYTRLDYPYGGYAGHDDLGAFRTRPSRAKRRSTWTATSPAWWTTSTACRSAACQARRAIRSRSTSRATGRSRRRSSSPGQHGEDQARAGRRPGRSAGQPEPRRSAGADQPQPSAARRGRAARAATNRRRRSARPTAPSPPAGAGGARGLGTLSIRVQPRDAVVLIDGERWEGGGVRDRLDIEV